MAWIKISTIESLTETDLNLTFKTVLDGYYNTDSNTSHKVKLEMTYYVKNAGSSTANIGDMLVQPYQRAYAEDISGTNTWYFDDNAWTANMNELWQAEADVILEPNSEWIRISSSSTEEFTWPSQGVNVLGRALNMYAQGTYFIPLSSEERLVPNSPVPQASALAQFPTKFYPGDTIALLLENANGDTFFENNYFYHKISLISDTLYQAGYYEDSTTITANSQIVNWAIPMEWNQIPDLALYPDVPVWVQFHVETYAAGGMLIGGSTYYDSYLQYLPGGIIDGDGEIDFQAYWKTIDAQTYELTGNDRTIIRHLSTVQITVSGLGYFDENGFRITVRNERSGDGAAVVVKEGMLNESVFTFYQDCVSNIFYVTVEAAGVSTTRTAWTGNTDDTSGEFLEYTKPEVILTNSQMNSQGVVEVEVNARICNIAFDTSQRNYISKLEYRYYNNESDSDWIEITDYTVDEYVNYIKYNWKTALNLPIGQNFNLEARITDSLYTITSPLSVAMYRPVFDWSKNDFKFNVPLICAEGIQGPNDGLDPLVCNSDFTVPNGCRFVYHGSLMPSFTVGQAQLKSNFITPGNETAFGANYFIVDNGMNNPQVVLHFYYAGVVETTVDKVVFYFDDLIANAQPVSTHWASAGGGNVSGFTIAQNNHSFSGWCIENIDGATVMTGRTCAIRNSTSKETLSSNYIGANAGATFYASGTIMYSGSRVV